MQIVLSCVYHAKNCAFLAGYVQVTKNYQRQELFLPLTGKNVSWKIRHNKKILRLKTLTRSIEPHQNFTSFDKRGTA